ncbi:L-dopachrome tautomerase-related protein [Bradyrhizobium sp. dw_78]|uniref:L-dopachrome tautomerase-related protein n=1 Tax=Bradyrhizobium sp. dw_78 TaxID=2719793 RepID=UPI001BD246A2|nr:L-dopachrome tautomerase-related protein [Bradyrhizobium sp. dw_78]
MSGKATKSARAAAALVAALSPSAALGASPQLEVAAESRTMIWNAVAVDHGRIFVAGPRWTGSTGPSVARIDEAGAAHPYPDAAWNDWRTGADPRRAFVNVNALHRDTQGGLWVIDTGSPVFGGDPLPGGAKAVRIDLATNKVSRIYPLGREVAGKGSYVDDIRFHGDHAYFTDAGRPGLIVLNLKTGAARRVLDAHAAATAGGRPIIVAGETVMDPKGTPLKVNSDPMEVSPDGRWFYFGPLEGPWSRIETRFLDDATLSADALSGKVEPWADLPPMGGEVMDSNGDLYFSDLAESALKRRSADGTITTIIADPRFALGRCAFYR